MAELKESKPEKPMPKKPKADILPSESPQKETMKIWPWRAVHVPWVIGGKNDLQGKLDGMLLRSAEKGRARSVETILNAGANIEAKDNNYWTALLLAISKGETETCMLLIERGAKFGSEHSNSYGLALEMAGICHYKDTVAFLRSMKPLQVILGKDNIMPFSLAFKECISGGA